jgi:hypothetical protein
MKRNDRIEQQIKKADADEQNNIKRLNSRTENTACGRVFGANGALPAKGGWEQWRSRLQSMLWSAE